MNKQKCVFLIFITAITALNINFAGNAISSEEPAPSLQWFPSLAADNGTVYIAWADERNGNYTRTMNNIPHKSGDIYLSKGSFKNGWVFDENIRINEIKGTTGHGSPSIAVDNRNIYAVWEDDRFGFEELYFSMAEKNNIKFKKDFPVVAETGSQVLPSIAILNETVYAAMMNKNTWDIEFTEGRSTGRSTNSVYRFDKPVRVNDDPAGNWHYAPSLAVDDEKNVCVAWLDARNGNYDIYFSHGVKENGIWQFSQNVRVNDDSTNASHYTPSLAFENGSVYIAWYDDRNKDFDIYFSTGRLEDNWKFDKNIRMNDDTGNKDQMHPSIAVRNGEVFAVWEDEREGASNIYFSRSIRRNDSLEFDNNIKVNDVSGKHYDPQIEISQDNIYTVWQAEKILYDNTVSGEYVTDAGDIFFSNGIYNGKDWEFSRSVKVNDDLTDSFTKPGMVFLGPVLGSVIFSILIVSFFKRKNKK
ncbi:MAG: hypothetical protein OIN84_10715 [Candidatus Methanoperedens sp.]|uniref:hypothetical protein n=1 Tax=Candidatus Methanoperedens sp. BLZ2 TaxID=2035255 RepID=UPI000BE3AF27|nr:hypothetical protein [Candidatus Methanoperedens sp. BLZ2]KAB2948484.1 MAG: hypothetical protein F9K14_01255 [Candidatus Methanoperedens sp.]MBZ0174414.1 hypothetical protein [Candidatus Methanoperedens nitroreducens]MCX9078434.1 hypothetical protein [Candidatus Methanoperedens sp.]